MTTPLTVLTAAPGAPVFPLFVHAHPDDETLDTGALLAWLTAQHVHVELVTCTRGERGEIVEGVLPTNVTQDDLVRVRQRELACALGALGVPDHEFLGSPPARAQDQQPRVYRDSGMRWIRAGLAGPSDGDDPQTLTAASLDELVGDLMWLIERVKPTVLVGYDDLGSYGHPDHLRAREITLAAARQAGLPMVEVASTEDAAGFEWFDLSDQRETVIKALRCYATQLTVHEDHIVHVGGQRAEIRLRIGLRLVPQP
ncbi:MAG: PIG-L family deacetylase [Acidobacteriota bacterium]|nr:PIG-L family deacetylase [Acidobacteriota bacterium]